MLKKYLFIQTSPALVPEKLNWIRRWFTGTNRKHIGILYLMFGFFNETAGLALSMIIRLEPTYPVCLFADKLIVQNKLCFVGPTAPRIKVKELRGCHFLQKKSILFLLVSEEALYKRNKIFEMGCVNKRTFSTTGLSRPIFINPQPKSVNRRFMSRFWDSLKEKFKKKFPFKPDPDINQNKTTPDVSNAVKTNNDAIYKDAADSSVSTLEFLRAADTHKFAGGAPPSGDGNVLWPKLCRSFWLAEYYKTLGPDELEERGRVKAEYNSIVINYLRARGMILSEGTNPDILGTILTKDPDFFDRNKAGHVTIEGVEPDLFKTTGAIKMASPVIGWLSWLLPLKIFNLTVAELNEKTKKTNEEFVFFRSLYGLLTLIGGAGATATAISSMTPETLKAWGEALGNLARGFRETASKMEDAQAPAHLVQELQEKGAVLEETQASLNKLSEECVLLQGDNAKLRSAVKQGFHAINKRLEQTLVEHHFRGGPAPNTIQSTEGLLNKVAEGRTNTKFSLNETGLLSILNSIPVVSDSSVPETILQKRSRVGQERLDAIKAGLRPPDAP